MEHFKQTSENQIVVKVLLATILFLGCMLIAAWYHKLTSRSFITETQLGETTTEIMNVDYSVPVDETWLKSFESREYIRIHGIPTN